ncbi:hypothetical protein [Chengkuizengella marina]|uniref:Uncharacterized protein n=1 Tax=Chengkuizengella marina TaxID=2507566 RepID=A0A6N9Q208_9BACL|nr:hypothetical protein [Chengkuizengella marina]NBI28324.1 hypothetical protein [Chengkuizengella marina]
MEINLRDAVKVINECQRTEQDKPILYILKCRTCGSEYPATGTAMKRTKKPRCKRCIQIDLDAMAKRGRSMR